MLNSENKCRQDKEMSWMCNDFINTIFLNRKDMYKSRLQRCLLISPQLTYPLRAHWHTRPLYIAFIFGCPFLLFLLTPNYSQQVLLILVQYPYSFCFRFAFFSPFFWMPEIVHILVLSILEHNQSIPISRLLICC